MPDHPTKEQLARLMALWVCQSNHGMRNALIAGNYTGAWKDAGIYDILGDSGMNELHTIYKNDGLALTAALKTNGLVDDDWSGPSCPPTEYTQAALDAMVSVLEAG